ncbi:MAG TPA: hypothetical protein VGB70_13060 [Allosphingosinicella sp.]|jgi:hypothetical protein
MPRYFFHFESHGVRVRDDIGLALPDAEAAWYQAVRSARDMIRAEESIGCCWQEQSVQIEDDKGVPVDKVPLQEIARFAGAI